MGWDQYHDSRDPMPLGWDGDAPDEVIDLYTAAQAQAGAVPLTDERLDVAVEAWFVGDNNYDFRERMRAAIDASHGIKGGQHGDSTA